MTDGNIRGLRILRAVRDQVGWDMVCLDDVISGDHRARQVWAYVETMDLSPIYAKIRAVEGGGGRPPIDPAILMALWLYATLEGVGSARQLERLCERDQAYRWICGGVGVNYHTLADFRVDAAPVLDDLLSRSMAALAAVGIVSLDCLAVDGVRVRASAGQGSFRRPGRLAELQAMAEQKVAALRRDLQADPTADAKRRRARALREAEALQARIAAAQRMAAEIEAERQREAQAQRRKQPKQPAEPRASTTDPQARIMKMADGGCRPAYNVQFKTDPSSGCVVGLDVTGKSSDRGQLGVAIDEIAARYGAKPARVLADGGYAAKDDIEAAFERGIEVFSPVPGSGGRPVPAKPQPKEGPGVSAWRERMSLQASFEIFRQRLPCERPHADARNRGLQRFLVRGIAKAKAVALWHVTAYNFLQQQRLWPQPA